MVLANTMNTFKNKLHNFWQKQEVKYIIIKPVLQALVIAVHCRKYEFLIV